jgi:hypothetical protein
METRGTEDNAKIRIMFKLKTENNKTHCCEYHKGQNLSQMMDDKNWVHSKVDYRTFKFTCSECEYEKIYEMVDKVKERVMFA